MMTKLYGDAIAFWNYRCLRKPSLRKSRLPLAWIVRLTAIGFLMSLFNAPVGAETLSPSGSFKLEGKGLVFGYEVHKGRLALRYLLPQPPANDFKFPAMNDGSDLEVAIHITGENRAAHHGLKLTGGNPGLHLQYRGRREESLQGGRRVILLQEDPLTGLQVESFYDFYDSAPVVRRYTRLTNSGSKPLGIEHVSSAMLNNYTLPGEGRTEEKLRIHWAHNSWQAEAQWRCSKPSELGWIENGAFQLTGIFFNSLGTWSSIRYLPMAMAENRAAGLTWFWQIEHNGAWHWEMSDLDNGGSYLYLGGPDEEHSQAWKELKPGEVYQTVPVALGCVQGGFDEAVAALTQYRRTACLKAHPTNSQCPVIFNDYMNCLMGDPTSEKLYPLIDAAAAAGCDYFVIDAGWYAERNESWWDAVGLWMPSRTRFPEGLPALLERIRSKGLTPGLWLELEVAGINSPLKNKPDDWFFQRHGRRVIDNSRYLLDFRNPAVRAHADEVVDRLVNQYGASYIKMDYNVDGLLGTEWNAASPGQGLLEHNRAYLAWLDGVYQRHPNLVIENCGSGGCRMDYAMLSRHQLQSSTDQTDYRKYPSILVGALAAVLPEQLAAWSYPKMEADGDEAAFNMVSAMVCRIHQSGHLASLKPEALARVREGIRLYRDKIRTQLPASIPFFPLGMPSLADPVSPVAVGLHQPGKTLLAVWRLSGASRIIVPTSAKGRASLMYPANAGIELRQAGGRIELEFPRPYMAALVEVTK